MPEPRNTTCDHSPASPSGLRGDEAELYERHQQALLRAVRRRIRGADAIVEEACSFAWMQLIQTQPERTERLFGWLVTVAVHEAYRLSRTAMEASVDGVEADPAGGRDDADLYLEAQGALRMLAELPAKQRRYLALFAAGYSYKEICALTRASYTNVNKHLTRARASVRAARAEMEEL